MVFRNGIVLNLFNFLPFGMTSREPLCMVEPEVHALQNQRSLSSFFPNVSMSRRGPGHRIDHGPHKGIPRPSGIQDRERHRWGVVDKALLFLKKQPLGGP